MTAPIDVNANHINRLHLWREAETERLWFKMSEAPPASSTDGELVTGDTALTILRVLFDASGEPLRFTRGNVPPVSTQDSGDAVSAENALAILQEIVPQ